MGENLPRALAISLLLHFLLLWPSPPERRADEPSVPLTATLREPPAVAEPSAPRSAAAVPAAPAPAARRREAARPRAVFADAAALPAVAAAATSAAPSTTDVLPRSENLPARVATAAAAAVAPAADGSAEGMRQYRLALAVEARRFKRYPPRALDAGIGGTAEIRIEIADGRMREVALARPSGDASLDAAALEMMRKAAPRTAVPETLRGREFVVSLPIVFDPAGE